MVKILAIVLLISTILSVAVIYIVSKDGALSTGSGIAGMVTIGPMYPVVREGEEQDRPYEADIVIKNKEGTKVVATTRSAEDGRFKLALEPGEYLIVPQPNDNLRFPRPGPQLAQVKSGQFTEVSIHYNTGIR